MAVMEESFIYLNTSFQTRDEIFAFVAQALEKSGRAKNAGLVIQGFHEREAMGSTYMDQGVCIPHCKSTAIENAAVVIVRNLTEVEWASEEDTDKASLLFFLAIPEEGKEEHLRILSKLAQMLLDDAFLKQVREAASPAQVLKLLDSVNE